MSDSGVKSLICANPGCEGKLANRIDHFFGKKGLDAKGISKATIEKLIDWGWINSIKDVYSNLPDHIVDWQKKPGFGAKSVLNIITSISNSMIDVDLASFISAIGIPLVGTAVAKEIVKYYSTWDEFRAAVGGDWTEFEGFGSEISRAINKFDYTEADEIAEMLSFKEEKPAEEVKSTINGLTFVITGKLSCKRDDIKAVIEKLGGKVSGSVSSKTDYLVCNDKDSTTGKSKDAKKLNIPIISEKELVDLIGNLND